MRCVLWLISSVWLAGCNGNPNDTTARPTPLDTAACRQLLQHSDWLARANAARTLGKIGNADSVGDLFNALSDGDPYVRTNVRRALHRLAKPEHWPAFRDALNSPDPARRQLAALILAADGDADAVAMLVAELDREDNPDLVTIIQTLAKTKAPAALPSLRRLALAADAEVQLNAILALGEYQDRASRDLLTNLRKKADTNREIRTACTVALERLR
jgi:HEAT repeat protein